VNTENVVKQLRVLWRTDRIIAELRMRHMLVGLGLRAFAALIAAFGLLMLELAAYFVLVQIWSAISAAAILGGVNFVIAAILFAIAARPPAGRELELATEIHGSAVDALQLEARALQSQASGMVHHPLNGLLPLLIVPLITIIIRSLKKPAATARAAAANAAGPSQSQGSAPG
jgi:membrane protein implicated in regulation of membrane protease activity